ncbi:MAG: adenylate kinase, partial [Pseudomonadota bacterium]|nr:adenylate kinase [Pseudomonadota bacterium]
MILILLGPPGSGKGTQAAFIKNKLDLPHLSTGDILRKSVKDATDLGKIVDKIMSKGKLVPDTLVLDIIKERILEEDCKKGFILDGYPRNISQAESLKDVLEEISMEIDHIIFLDVDFDILQSRIKTRAKENNEEIRVDDTSEVLIKRLDEYKNQTAPLENYYTNYKNFNKINGMSSISNVSLEIEKLLDK